jgi:hypothetical protein
MFTDLGFDQRVVDLAAEGAGAAVVLDRRFAARSVPSCSR